MNAPGNVAPRIGYNGYATNSNRKQNGEDVSPEGHLDIDLCSHGMTVFVRRFKSPLFHRLNRFLIHFAPAPRQPRYSNIQRPAVGTNNQPQDARTLIFRLGISVALGQWGKCRSRGGDARPVHDSVNQHSIDQPRIQDRAACGAGLS